jgi:hypothetical protein
MDSLVLELQRDAIDVNATVSSLLLKAKVVATKLGLDDALSWINAEISGYTTYDAVPRYRTVAVQVEAWNPYHGWQHVGFEDDELREIMTSQKMAESISVIEDLFRRAEDGGKIGKAVEGAALQLIHRSMPVKLNVETHISPTALRHVLDIVRERILTWSLELEKRGVLGKGMSFSKEEKKHAERAPSIVNIGSVTNMAGSIGGFVENQRIDSTQWVAQDFRTSVRRFVDEMDGLISASADDDIADLRAATEDLRAALDDRDKDEGVIKKLLRKLPAAAVSLGNYATQAMITAEVGRLIGS